MLITEQSTIDKYYRALVDREQRFVGIFYVGVKTTSVFCIATCRARKPKRENVEFYTSLKEALDNGYRPCKICKPTENAATTPAQVEKAIALVKENPKQKISDAQLRALNISPEVVRRWFGKNYGMTFHAFQRMYRVNNALLELKMGGTATAAAFDSGYESLSGFGYTYKKLLGSSPQHSLNHSPILINRLTTPLGPMFVCATDKGICLLEFVDRKMLETEFSDLQRLLKSKIIIGENEHIAQARNEMAEYFTGNRKNFTVSLDHPGSDFQKTVWTELQSIGFAETATYSELAEKLGKPVAVRAVGRANGANRISIMVPCHRIIGKDGQLTGYGGGLERKKWLLNHEQQFASN